VGITVRRAVGSLRLGSARFAADMALTVVSRDRVSEVGRAEEGAGENGFAARREARSSGEQGSGIEGRDRRG
jgi:hypothetical protein